MFWTRELMGWTMLLAGLAALALGLWFVVNYYLARSGPTLFVGFLLLRSGQHMLKVATAVRIAREIEVGRKTHR